MQKSVHLEVPVPELMPANAQRAREARPRVLADTWYASKVLDGMCVVLDREMTMRCPKWITSAAGRFPAIHALVFFWLGQSYDLLVAHGAGAWLLLLLEACFAGKQRVVLLEFMGQRSRIGFRHLLQPLLLALLRRPAFRKAVAVAQVLTTWELDEYAAMYGVPKNRFRFIPWFGSQSGEELAPRKPGDKQAAVVASGRAACDWETLFCAADGRSWPLTVVCSAQDLPLVERLNTHGQARVLCEIPSEEHDRLVQSASVYVLCLKEIARSSGQIRLRFANRMGIPTVVARVQGLQGYYIDGETALAVEAEDPAALREAVERLLNDDALCEYLRARAFEYACRWTYTDYVDAVRAMVASRLPVQG